MLKNILVSKCGSSRFGSLAQMRQFSLQSAKYSKPRTAIVMLNMGGPQTTDQVHDYLLRIMTDCDMIQLPVQSKLGPWIAKRRTPEVQKKYAEIGGGSPIFKWTNIQGELLCKQLDKVSPETAPHKHYVAFRYLTPLTEDTLKQVEQDEPERVVLFSQYPQYSCATSGSSFNVIYTHYISNKNGLANAKWSIIDRWGTHSLLAKTFADNIRKELEKFPAEKRKLNGPNMWGKLNGPNMLPMIKMTAMANAGSTQ